jgi:hypothetical protein
MLIMYPLVATCAVEENTVDFVSCPTLSAAFPLTEFAFSANPLALAVPPNFEVSLVFNVSVTLCAPAVLHLQLNYSTCISSAHTLMPLVVTIVVTDVNESPVFSTAAVNLTAPGVGVVNQSIGYPLSQLAVDPDTSPAFSTLTFMLASGACGRLSSVPLPVSIRSSDGQLFYTVAGALTAWQSPLQLCVTAVDGLGLNASVTVNLILTAVGMQLFVFPPSIDATHATFGTTMHNVSVSFYAGTFVNETWAVRSLSVPWATAVRSSASSITVIINSTLLTLSHDARIGMVTIETSGTYFPVTAEMLPCVPPPRSFVQHCINCSFLALSLCQCRWCNVSDCAAVIDASCTHRCRRASAHHTVPSCRQPIK